MIKLGILYFCTGAYSVFWDGFYASSEKYFLNSVQKEYFIFTDSDAILKINDNPQIHPIYLEHKKWPLITLLRYEEILKNKELFKDMDYLFFMNSNLLVINYIEEKEILPNGNELTAVRLFSRETDNLDVFYEKNKKSSAYIPDGTGMYYVAGGLNGAKTDKYLDMAKVCHNQIKQDINNNVLASWHDESHLNRYLIDYPDVRLLDKYRFCIDEDSRKPETKIIIRNKNKYLSYGQRGFRTENDFSDSKFRNNIVVYGTGKLAEKWYQKNKDKVKIKCFVCTEPEAESFHGIRIEKACAEVIKGSFVVLALSNGYSYAYAMMQECGYEEYRDFLKSSEYDLL